MAERVNKRLGKVRLKPGLTSSYMDEDIAIVNINKDFSAIYSGQFRLEFFMVLFCREGTLSLSVNTEMRQLKAKEVLLCRPNDLLCDFQLSADFRGAAVCFSQQAIRDNIRLDNEIWNPCFTQKHPALLTLSSDEDQLFHLYAQLVDFRVQMKNRPYHKEVIAALQRATLLDLLGNLKPMLDGKVESVCRRKDFLFQAFIKKLTSMEVKPRSVTWYADQLCITPKYLTSVCRNHSGRNAFELINEAVMTDIRYQLKYSQKSIKEIADYLDFPNISFFGKYVRKHVGCSPKEYRRRLQAEQ